MILKPRQRRIFPMWLSPAPHSTPAMHVALGIDIDLLRIAAESLGTTKLTLFVPVPVKDANRKPIETFVNKPVAVCPAPIAG